jgi:hypothetical protein
MTSNSSNVEQRLLHKGTIIAMYRERVSRTSLLAIEDDLQGKVLNPCEGTPIARAFDAVFGGVIVGGRFSNDGIKGERIYYSVDTRGVLEGFNAVDEAPQALVQEYEAKYEVPQKRSREAKRDN